MDRGGADRRDSHAAAGGRAGRVLLLSGGAGLALALLETAVILAQRGAGMASLPDLALLVTWLALPYAALLAAAGLVGRLALRRVDSFEAAFAASSLGLAAWLWLRGAATLPGSAGTRIVIEAGLFLVAAATGAAAARLSATRGLAPALGGLVSGLGLLVALSRPEPGPFGRPQPPAHMALRFLLAAGVAAAVAALLFLSRRSGPNRGGAATWARRAAIAALIVWCLIATRGFATLLSGQPEPVAQSRGAGGGAVAGDSASPVGPNVVLISIDTLRADHLSCYGYTHRTSPSIDRLASEGIRFVWSTSTASFTLPAHASMMTGLFPSSHGATYQNRNPKSFSVRGLGSGEPTLAGILREHGYQTAGFVSGPLMSRQFGFSRGFGIYDDRYDRLQSAPARLLARSLLFKAGQMAGLWTGRDLDSQRIAVEVNERVMSWLRGRRPERPFFLFVHYWDPHGPYDPPDPFGRRPGGERIAVEYDMDRLLAGEYTLTPAALADTLALYDGEIAYVDQHVGQLIDALRAGGELNRSIVFLTSDHGESFGEHGHWEHSRVLYEDLLRVPFIVRLPGGRAAGTVVSDMIAQPTDILPMALAAAGLTPPEGIEGRDLTRWLGPGAMAPGPERAGVRSPGLAFAELDRNLDWPTRWGKRYQRDLESVRTSRWKYIRSSQGPEELYDLEKDGGEAVDLSASDPGATATMRALVEAWRRSLKTASGEGSEDGIDEGLKESLRSLGYVQ